MTEQQQDHVIGALVGDDVGVASDSLAQRAIQ
jgi:hypothetical protein